jgi:hypothetical protein
MSGNLDQKIKHLYTDLQSLRSSVAALELWKDMARKEKDKTDSRMQELEQWKKTASYKIQVLEDWKRNLLCAKSDNKIRRTLIVPGSENGVERSRAVLFVCPLCPSYLWYKLMKFTVETHGNFWVEFDPSDYSRGKKCWLDSTQYEFYPALKEEKRKSWRDSNDFKAIREHLLLCYRGKNSSELDDDKTGRFDMWRRMDMVKKERKFRLDGRGMRCYEVGEVKRIIDDRAKEEIEKKRSKFLVQFKDTFDPNLMERVAGTGYRPKKTWAQQYNDRKRREREKTINQGGPPSKVSCII